jgi:group I intron endonuclease
MNDIITTITDSQPENKKEQVIWEENESTIPMKKSELPSMNVVCDITIETKNWKENVLLKDIIKTKKKISGIYKIINKINGKYYVGSSQNIFGIKGRCGWDGRLWQHMNMIDKQRHTNKHLQRACNKYNLENFIFKIVELCSSDTCIVTEQLYLDIAKTEKLNCYNTSFIAGRVEMTEEIRNKIRIGRTGKIASPETLLKMSAITSARWSIRENTPLFGKKVSDETKKKISVALMGRYRGELNPNWGKHHSEETRHKMSANSKPRRGINHTGFDFKINTFKNIKTNEEFVGYRADFYRKYNISPKDVHGIISRRRKSTHNWIVIASPTSLVIGDGL